MIREYIFLAAGCISVGIILSLIVLVVNQRLGIDFLGEYLWVLAIPAVLSLTLNILLLEIYRKFRKKDGKEKMG